MEMYAGEARADFSNALPPAPASNEVIDDFNRGCMWCSDNVRNYINQACPVTSHFWLCLLSRREAIQISLVNFNPS